MSETLGTLLGEREVDLLGESFLEGMSEVGVLLGELEGMPDGKTLWAALGKEVGIRDGDLVAAKLNDGNSLGTLDGESHAEVQGEPSRNPPVSDQIKSLSKPQPLS